jgi:N-acetylglucosaminyl-diphospho-decaprenol L-rhamnosyltransferase
MSIPLEGHEMEVLPAVDVLVCNFNTKHLIKEMTGALEASHPKPPLRYLVVDNASTDGSQEYIRSEHPSFELICNESNVGFGRANNQLLPLVRSPFVLLLNTDAFVAKDTLAKTLRHMQANPECGVLGVKLLSSDGSLQPSCRYFPSPLNIFLSKTGLGKMLPWVKLVDNLTWSHNDVRECDWVPGCYYLIRREVIEAVGLFDPRYFLYYEEVDHCKRVKSAGWQVVYFGNSSTVHIGGESAKSVGDIDKVGKQLSHLQVESEILYLRKHHGLTGLVFHFGLVVTADLMSALNSLVRRRRRKLSAFHSTSMFIEKLKATHAGSTPTL